MVGVLSKPTDYTDKDFDALRARVQSLVQSVYPDWTSHQVADFSNILLECFAFVGDVTTYYQDNQARETRWTTATQRRNLLHLTSLIGYRPPTSSAARVVETFTIVSGGTGKVTLPKASSVSTENVTDAAVFRLLDDLVFDAGANPRTQDATVENAEPEEELFQATGLPTQSLRLARKGYLDDSAEVSDSVGTFEAVTDFLSSAPTDRVFRVEVDQIDRATIIFGDGLHGALPSGTISVQYKIGGGEAGNVEAGTLKRLEQVFADEFGAPVTLSVTNALKADGGVDRPSVAEIRYLAPLSIRALDRSVAREDFEIHARKVANVSRALMLTSDQDPGVPENTGILFVIPKGGGLPSVPLKAAVLDQVTTKYPHTLTFKVLVQDPIYKPIDFYAVVFLRQGQTGESARAAIEVALAAYFVIELANGTPNPSIDFGFYFKDTDGAPSGEIPFSDLFNIVRDTPTVRKVGDAPTDFLVNGLHEDVPIGNNEFPVLGTVALINGDTGQPL